MTLIVLGQVLLLMLLGAALVTATVNSIVSNYYEKRSIFLRTVDSLGKKD